MSKRLAQESQNQIQFDIYNSKGGVTLGPYTSYIWRNDPKHLCFLLSRYKFCAKLLTGKKEVLEVGCGDSFGTAIVLQTTEKIHAVDIEPLVIEDNIKRVEYGNRCSYEVLDITSKSPNRKFDAAFALDVIEHIPAAKEYNFISNIVNALNTDGMLIIGTPNLNAQQYASPESAVGHINLKNADNLKKLLLNYFNNVFIFSMNDEIVHTGFHAMAHYLFGVGIGRKA